MPEPIIISILWPNGWIKMITYGQIERKIRKENAMSWQLTIMLNLYDSMARKKTPILYSYFCLTAW